MEEYQQILDKNITIIEYIVNLFANIFECNIGGKRLSAILNILKGIVICKNLMIISCKEARSPENPPGKVLRSWQNSADSGI